MLFRVSMVTVLLGSSVFLNLEDITSLSDPRHIALYVLIVATYALTLLYAVLLRRLRRLTALAFAQLLGDVLMMATLVAITGGTESVFTFIFTLAIINGAIVLFRPGALVVASFSSLAFLGLAVTEAGLLGRNFLPFHPFHPTASGGRNLYYVSFVHVTSFYLVAILASYLAEQLRRAGLRLEEKQVDLDKLRSLNDSIVNCLSTGLISTDAGGMVLSFNPGAEAILGVRQDEVLGRILSERFPELGEALRTLLPGEIREVGLRLPGGGEATLQCEVAPLRDPAGRGLGHLVSFRDVTRQKSLEEAVKRSERLAAVGRLAAGLAHEIRNPLASISGSVELLKDASLKPAEKRLLDIVLRETRRLNGLLTDFLSYARPRPPVLVETDLRVLVAETVEAFRNDCRDASVTVEERPAAGPVRAMVDGDQIRQVLWNLLRNARQAIPEGGAIRVAVGRLPDLGLPGDGGGDAEGGLVGVSIADSGVGMTREELDRIFDPFYTTKSGGTGLGLATVYRIVEDHGGSVSVRSAPGEGSTFTVLLPERGERTGKGPGVARSGAAGAGGARGAQGAA